MIKYVPILRVSTVLLRPSVKTDPLGPERRASFLLRLKSGRAALGDGRKFPLSMKAKVERVNLLDAAITHQERRVIRSQSDPVSETIGELRKVLQT